MIRMESPGTSSLPPSCPLVQYTVQKIAAAIEGLINLSPLYGDYAKKVVEQGIDGRILVDLLESPNSDEFNQFLVQLGVTLVAHQTRLKRLFNDLHQNLAIDHATERALWLKGCLILEACAKGVKPFVGRVMERLHKRVLENVKSDILRELGACEDKEWDCRDCVDADDANFTDVVPVALSIRTIDSNGIMDCGVAHGLKSGDLLPCHLSNIPALCFPDCDCATLPLFMCPNPADISKPESSTFLLLYCSEPAPTDSPWSPFLVTCCESSSNPPLAFHAVFSSSYPGLPANQVQHAANQVQPQQPLPPPTICDKKKSPPFSLAFWSIKEKEDKSGYKDLRHGLKSGRMLRFDGGEGNSLPTGINPGCRYLVTDATDFSFKICGPILTPILPFPLTAESYTPLVVIRRSPIGR